jgi:hypothetical protein
MPVNIEKNKKMRFPPVVKLLVRGYIIIGFLLILESTGIFTNIGVIIFLVTITSISMVFGIGYLLVMRSRPVRASNMDIPNTVLLFVKGILMIYFVSLLTQFNILPARITSVLIFIMAGSLMIIGVLSYIFEVMQRSRPLPKRFRFKATRSRPRVR